MDLITLPNVKIYVHGIDGEITYFDLMKSPSTLNRMEFHLKSILVIVILTSNVFFLPYVTLRNEK